jgi:hypothetical protein
LEFISRQGLGAITSLMAREGIAEFEDAGDALIELVYQVQGERAFRIGLSFEDLVDEAVALKRRRYNTATSERDVAKEIEDAELAKRAREYKRQSDGG